MRILLALGIFLIFACSEANSTSSSSVTIKGQLVGVDGKPIEQSHVVAKTNPNTKESIAIEVPNKDGFFKFELPANEVYFLEFSGINHNSNRTDIITNSNIDEVEISVQLTGFKVNDRDKVILLDKSQGEIQTQEMVKGDNGVYSVSFENNYDTLRYQIFGHTSYQKATNGTQQDAYEFDGFGDYNSLIINKKGQIIVEFDPSKLPSSENSAEFEYLTVQQKNFNNKLKEIDKYKIELFAFANRPREDRMLLMKTRANHLKSLDSIYKLEKDQFVKNYIGLNYMEIAAFNLLPEPENMINNELIKNTLDNLPVESSFWAFGNVKYFLPTMFHYAGYNQLNHPKLIELYENNNAVSEFILVEWMQKYQTAGNKEKVKELFSTYKTDYADSHFFDQIQQMFDPNRNIALGNKAPDFDLVNLDDQTTINLARYSGKFVLIDFWATWCGPCMREMDNLHLAYDKFKNKNFEILSLSFDKSKQAVSQHRTNSVNNMPWDHAFIEGGFRNPLSQKYEVKGIPKPILIDPSGEIVALEGDLRGPKLIETLQNFLGE